jgi:hypothetical protein
MELITVPSSAALLCEEKIPFSALRTLEGTMATWVCEVLQKRGVDVRLLSTEKELRGEEVKRCGGGALRVHMNHKTGMTLEMTLGVNENVVHHHDDRSTDEYLPPIWVEDHPFFGGKKDNLEVQLEAAIDVIEYAVCRGRPSKDGPKCCFLDLCSLLPVEKEAPRCVDWELSFWYADVPPQSPKPEKDA